MKKSRILLLAIEAVLYCFASLGMWHLFVALLQDIGSGFAMIGYAAPHYLLCLSTIYILFVFHLFVKPRDKEKLIKCSKVNGIIAGVLGLAIVALGIAGVATGKYSGILAGGISSLFPLDHILFGVLMIGLGVLCFLSSRLFDFDKLVYFEKPKGKAWDIVMHIVVPVYILISLFFFGDILYFFYMLDYSFKNFLPMLTVYALCILPTVWNAMYEWWWSNIEDPIKKEMIGLKLSMISVSVNVVVVALFLLAEFVSPYFIPQSGTALFPGDFMISIQFGPIFLTIAALAPTITSFFRNARLDKKAEKEEKTAVSE